MFLLLCPLSNLFNKAFLCMHMGLMDSLFLKLRDEIGVSKFVLFCHYTLHTQKTKHCTSHPSLSISTTENNTGGADGTSKKIEDFDRDFLRLRTGQDWITSIV